MLPVAEREHNQFNAGDVVGVKLPTPQVSQAFSYWWEISAAQVQEAAPKLVKFLIALEKKKGSGKSCNFSMFFKFDTAVGQAVFHHKHICFLRSI